MTCLVLLLEVNLFVYGELLDCHSTAFWIASHKCICGLTDVQKIKDYIITLEEELRATFVWIL